MPYQKIIEKIDDLEELSAVGFPDGSVDNYCRFEKGKGRYMESKDEVAERIESNDSSSFRLEREKQEPGGKSLNMSMQCNSLGLDTAHYGFLDHELLENLDFETYSMGEPAQVTIGEFEQGSILLAHENKELVDWSLESMKQFSGDIAELISADVVGCANWIGLRHMNEELKEIAGLDFEAEVFNFDPGNLTDVRPEIVREMFETLEKLSEDYQVLVHANTDEVETTAEIYGIEGSIEEKINLIQEQTGVTAYILHNKPRAVAGTEEGRFEVENLVTEHIETRTGAGDRFDAGVASARAAGWRWEESLALGNLCAVHYVENNETATPSDLREQVEDKVKN
ncbi:MAG: sugar/nucleoside kinase (ribokinase family) [Candidatus Nanohaloarchaea archaeon]|jgi:sugar/nucleoside kinase (ribokinase family)